MFQAYRKGIRQSCHAAISLCVVFGLAIEMAAAAPIFYDDESLFLADTSGLTLESFEGFAPTGTFALNEINNGDFTVSVAGTELGILNSPYNGSFATEGDNFVRYQSGAGENLTFSFVDAINSFGISFTDWGDFGTGLLSFSNDNGDTHDVAVTPQINGALNFFGVVDLAFDFNQVSFLNTIAGEAYGFDEVYYGRSTANVFEPQGLGLMMVGLLGIITGRRKTK